MSENQRKVLIVCYVVTALMLLFPPFGFQGQNGFKSDLSYALIFSPPKDNHTVMIELLGMQWLAVWVISGISFCLYREKKSLIERLVDAHLLKNAAQIESAKIIAEAIKYHTDISHNQKQRSLEF